MRHIAWVVFGLFAFEMNGCRSAEVGTGRAPASTSLPFAPNAPGSAAPGLAAPSRAETSVATAPLPSAPASAPSAEPSVKLAAPQPRLTPEQRSLRAIELVMSTPEWGAHAARVRREPDPYRLKPVLGLGAVQDPAADCQLGTPACRVTLTAMRVCGSCAGGLWVEFEVDPEQQLVFIKDETGESTLAYGTWRNAERMAARSEQTKEFRTLGAEQQAFPDLHPGAGPLGYGAPTAAPASRAVRSVLKAAGFELLRVERYAGDFLVFVVAASAAAAEGAAPASPARAALRKWGAALVNANGARASEVLIAETGERYQFDRYALQAHGGGVYALRAGDFHPWLAAKH
jgi:hypothetical protein